MGLIANESVEKEAEALSKAIERSIEAVSTALKPLAQGVDTNGDEQLALIAVLRSFADLLSEELSDSGRKATVELQALVTRSFKEHVR